jgi:Arm DNA-binding domain
MSDRKRIGLREVRALAPGEIVWDSGLPGFAARRQRSEAVSYVLKYRTSVGREQRWHTIGRHGAPWTPETARTEALRVLGELAKGADPAGAKSVAKAAPTVAELAVRFLTEHAEAKRKPRTAREYRRLIEKVILPTLGRKRVGEVTRGRTLPGCTMPSARPLPKPIAPSRCSQRYLRSRSAKASARTAPIPVDMSNGFPNGAASASSRPASWRG